MVKKLALTITLLFFIAACGGNSSTNQEGSGTKGTKFNGYVPGEVTTKKNNSPQEGSQTTTTFGIFFTSNGRDVVVPANNITILDQEAFTYLGGNAKIGNVVYTIGFTFLKTTDYPHTYNLVAGRPNSQDDAVLFYQETVSEVTYSQPVSGSSYQEPTTTVTTKTVSTVKDGTLVIDKYDDKTIKGSFWARIGLDNGEDLYIENGKINLER